MDDVESGGAAGAETSDIGAVAAPGRERRMTAGRKREAVLRLLRGEPLELVAGELAVCRPRHSPQADFRPAVSASASLATWPGVESNASSSLFAITPASKRSAGDAAVLRTASCG